MTSIAKRIEHVQQKIHQTERQAHRPKGSVRLLAVSKTKPVSDLIQAYQWGLRDFAESYVQEALDKQQALAQFDICWHFIGPIQSNKTRAIAEHFSWVHSVDRLKIAQRLNQQRPSWMAPLNICLQINISGESSKSGLAVEEVGSFIAAIAEFPQLQLRGLMTIPAPAVGLEQQRIPFRQLHALWIKLDTIPLDTLSMGMSNDLQAAIQEGTTMLRIGTALFGSRASVK